MPKTPDDSPVFLPPGNQPEMAAVDPTILLDTEAARLAEIAEQVSAYLGDLALNKHNQAAARTTVAKIGEIAVTLADIRSSYQAFAAQKIVDKPVVPAVLPTRTVESTPPSPAARPENLTPEQTYAQTVQQIIASSTRNGRVSIGAIAYKLGNGKLPRDEYGKLMDYMNTSSGLTYTHEAGIYEVIPVAPRERVRRRLSSPVEVPAVLIEAVAAQTTEIITTPTETVEVTPDIVITEPDTTVVTPAQPVEPTPIAKPESSAELSDEEKTARLLLRVQYYASAGRPFGADELRKDPEVMALFSKQELSKLGFRLSTMRTQILDRVEALGGKGNWIAQTVGGKQKYLLAFYSGHGHISTIQKQLADETRGLPTADTETTTENTETATTDATVDDPAETVPVPAIVQKPVIRRRRITTTTPDPLVKFPVIKAATEIAAPEKPAPKLFSLHKVIGPDGTPAVLDAAALAELRNTAESLFDAADGGRVRREAMLQRVAMRHGLTVKDADTILQQMYAVKTLGKSVVEGDSGYFTLDASLRRDRKKANTGNEDTPAAEQTKRREKNAVELGIGDVLNILVTELTHVQMRLSPQQISRFIETTYDRKVSPDDIKRACRMVPSYIISNEAKATNMKPRPNAKTGGASRMSSAQKGLKIWIRDQRVKEAWKNDGNAVLEAMANNLTFEQYLESLNT